MSEFTKEELISIQFCIEVAMGGDSSIRDRKKEINSKIQSMIDNYCEHENSGQDYNCNRCWDCHACW